MAKLWAARVETGICGIEDVPERYKAAVKVLLDLK